MDFKDLYLFVGPPMTRGPPPLPLVPSLLPPPPVLSSSSSSTLLPPTLPRPPSSWSKKPQKQRVRIKPHHRFKPSPRHVENQVRPQAKTFVGPYDHADNNAREVQMMMSDLELEYRTARKDWQDGTPTDVRSLHSPGDPLAMWTTVLDMSPQFLALDPVVGEYF